MTDKVSKTKVRKAGDIYRSFRVDSSISTEQYNQALDVISKFRAEHNSSLDSVIKEIDLILKKLKIDNAIIAKRLKRSISIEKKLKRFPKMSLDRMQDIAGCRVIVQNQKELRRVQKLFKDKFNLRHNYIKHPKDDGYRSIHYTIKQDGYFVEIQLRTKIQHAWATALEIVDIFEKKSLKTKEDVEDKSSKEWAEFFKICSNVFAELEFRNKIDYNELKSLFSYYNKLKIEKKFSAYFKFPALRSDVNEGYYLLHIDLERREATPMLFNKDDFDKAIEQYKYYENKSAINPNYVVALVSTEDLKNIKKAYPNFFSHSQEFLDLIKELETIYIIEKDSRSIVNNIIDFILNITGKKV